MTIRRLGLLFFGWLICFTGQTLAQSSNVGADQKMSAITGQPPPLLPSSTSPGAWRETADESLVQHAPINRVAETKWNRYARSALNLPDWLDLGLENRTRYEALSNPWRKGEFGYDQEIPMRSRLRVGINPGGPFRFLTELQDSRSQLTRTGDFSGNTMVDQADIIQLFVSATSRNFLSTGLRTDLHFGRLTMDFGNRRLVARNDFRNTTNAFDGVHYAFGQEKAWRVRTFFVRPVKRFLQSLDQEQTNTLFWGVYYETQHVSWLQADLYYLGLNDQLSAVPSTQRKYSTFGTRLYKLPGVGQFEYEIESDWQMGKTGTKDHFAFNQHAEIGYTFKETWTPRLRAQFDYASGTNNPNGSQNGTFDNLYGARNFELMPTGIFGPFTRENLISPGWRLSVKPLKQLSVEVKHRFWYLAQSRNAFVGSGLSDPTGRSGNNLGADVQLRVVWSVLANLSLEFGYDHWFKGSYFNNIASAQHLSSSITKDTDYFYLASKVKL